MEDELSLEVRCTGLPWTAEEPGCESKINLKVHEEVKPWLSDITMTYPDIKVFIFLFGSYYLLYLMFCPSLPDILVSFAYEWTWKSYNNLSHQSSIVIWKCTRAFCQCNGIKTQTIGHSQVKISWLHLEQICQHDRGLNSYLCHSITLGKFRNFGKPWFPYLQNGARNCISPTELLECKNEIGLIDLEIYLTN